MQPLPATAKPSEKPTLDLPQDEARYEYLRRSVSEQKIASQPENSIGKFMLSEMSSGDAIIPKTARDPIYDEISPAK